MTSPTFAAEMPALIPLPQKADVHLSEQPFLLIPGSTPVSADVATVPAAALLHEWFDVPNAQGNATTGGIRLKVEPQTDPSPEAYTLRVTKDCVTLSAATTSGALMGVQTLRQLVPMRQNKSIFPLAVPACTVVDAPALQWRGMMLDVSRHFVPYEQVLRLIDAMAFMKLNTFHWHLFDCSGWRLESERYPELTKIGAVRGPKGHEYGGYYTKEQARPVVAYAAARGINVVPEFEMPGHTDAVMACFPELSCKGTPKKLPETTSPLAWDSLEWFFVEDQLRPFCAGNEKTFEFIGNIFDEYLDVFPYEVWHCGGDERPGGRWENCTKCQDRMKQNGIADEHALQEWFMRRVSDMLAARGKRPVSWAVSRSDTMNPTDMDELGNGAYVMNWHDGTRFAAAAGRKVINAKHLGIYLDYLPYKKYRGWKRPDWFLVVDLEKVYHFDTVPAGLTAEQAKNVIGAEACVWTEFIPADELFSWIYPRALAVGEVGWRTQEQRDDYPGFAARVEAMRPRLSQMGIEYGCPATDEEIRLREAELMKSPVPVPKGIE